MFKIMKATEQYFSVVLFIIIMLYKVVLTVESVDKILKLTTQMNATVFSFGVMKESIIILLLSKSNLGSSLNISAGVLESISSNSAASSRAPNISGKVGTIT